MRSRAIRLRSRAGVSGSRHRRGKSVAKARTLLALVLVEERVSGALAFVVLLGGGERPQLVVPLGLERGGDQAVVGIDPEVTALGQIGLVAGALDLLAAQPVGFLGPGCKLVLD